VYAEASPGACLGIVCSLTLMVSKECPATTVHTPPNPPDKKYFTGFTDFLSDIFSQIFSTTNSKLFNNKFIQQNTDSPLVLIT
jgi:hypothetical protein